MKKENFFKNLWKRNQIIITALALMIAIAGYLNFTGKQMDDEVLFTTSAQFEEADAETVEETMNNGLLDETSLYDISEEDDTYYTEIGSLDEDIDLSALGESDAELEDMYVSVETSAGAAEPMLETDTELTDSGNENHITDIPGEAIFTNTMSVTSLAEANLMREQTRAQNKEMLLNIINNENISEEAKQDAINSMIALTSVAQKECDAMIMLQAKGFTQNVVSINGDFADVCIGMNELSQAQIAQIEDIVKRKTGIAAENINISPVGVN